MEFKPGEPLINNQALTELQSYWNRNFPIPSLRRYIEIFTRVKREQSRDVLLKHVDFMLDVLGSSQVSEIKVPYKAGVIFVYRALVPAKSVPIKSGRVIYLPRVNEIDSAPQIERLRSNIEDIQTVWKNDPLGKTYYEIVDKISEQKDSRSILDLAEMAQEMIKETGFDNLFNLGARDGLAAFNWHKGQAK